VPAERPLKVVHVVHSLAVGGLENGVVNLVNGRDESLQHTIVCMTTDGPLTARLRPEVKVFALGKKSGHDPRTFMRLSRLLRTLKPDVVHSRNWGTFDAVLAARLAGVRHVIHGEHGRDITDPKGLNPRRNRWRRMCAPFVSRFVTVCDDLRRWLVEEVCLPASKVVTVYNGVEIARYSNIDRSAARARLGLAADSLAVGTVGRLDPVKDQVGLIRAFDLLAHRYPKAVLVIAGDGPCRAALENLVAASKLQPRVRLLGERDDVPEVLAALDVFVLPSIAEGMSNTILEAMASGLPVVATRVGGNAELVEHGVNGILVSSQDPERLANAVERYLEHQELVACHGRNSKRRAQDHFSLERMQERYSALYRGVAARSEVPLGG
jgi:sugar transferase (PEP-CTERM/EpsH1 system associated)